MRSGSPLKRSRNDLALRTGVPFVTARLGLRDAPSRIPKWNHVETRPSSLAALAEPAAPAARSQFRLGLGTSADRVEGGRPDRNEPDLRDESWFSRPVGRIIAVPVRTKRGDP